MTAAGAAAITNLRTITFLLSRASTKAAIHPTGEISSLPQLLRRARSEIGQHAVGAGALNAIRLFIIALSPSIQPLFAAAMIIEYSPHLIGEGGRADSSFTRRMTSR